MGFLEKMETLGADRDDKFEESERYPYSIKISTAKETRMFWNWNSFVKKTKT